MSRTKYTPKFKIRVVLEALKERMTNQELARKFNIAPQQISTWKRNFLNGAEDVFAKGKNISAKTEQEQKEEELLRTIGQQKVEFDFFKKALL